jgi:hypothetical protein
MNLFEQLKPELKKELEKDIVTSVEIKKQYGSNTLTFDFSADCGKFGTDEMLDGYTLTPERLLEILQSSEIITDEENYS